MGCEAGHLGAPPVAVYDVPEPVGWVCTFETRAGAKARASFASAEAAMDCAERHTAPQGVAFEWRDDPTGGRVLETPVGFYRVDSVLLK